MKKYSGLKKIFIILSVLFFSCSFSNAFGAFQLAGGGQAATTVCAGSTNVIIHYITFTGTPVATTGIGLTTTGTYVAATDITNFKLWVNTSNSLAGATLLATNSSPANAGAQTAFSFASRTPTNAEFYIITIDVQTTAVNNRTIAVNSTSNTNITPTSAANPNANSASGTQTFTALTITTGSITGSPFCPGATVSVPFTVGACSFTGGNTFTAQLSDATGSFAAPTTIGTISAVSSGTITATVPSNAAAGTGYRIRIIGSTPAITGSNNGTNLTISAITITTGAISGSPFCPGASVNVPFTVGTCSFLGGNTFTAQLSDASGSFASPTTIGTLSAISSGTITTTIPSNAAAGTGYRIRVIGSNPAITGTNNGTNLTISAITITTGAISGSPFCAGASLNVPFTVGTCSFLGGNTFTAQLSDASGSFAAPTTIGTLSALSSGTISATIPTGAAAGTAYRIRVIGSNPAITGSNNGTNLTVTPQIITTGPVSTPLCKGANVNIPFTVCGAFTGGNTFTAQLSNATGSFAAPTTIGTLSGTGSGVIAATIPVGSANGTGYLVRVIASTPAITGTTNSNGNITISTPMTYSVSAVSQFTTGISKNCSLLNSILEIQVTVAGSCSPQTITQFNFNTASSTSPTTDITKARVYYTGQTQGFTTSQQFGSEIFAPAGSFTIDGAQELSFGAGTYYFYLAYEIPTTATAGDVVDASLTSFVIDGSTITDMSTPDPLGSRTITNGSTCSYTITKFPDLYFCGSNYTATAAQTVAFTLNESTAGSEFDKSQTNKTIVLKLPPGFAFAAAGSVSYTGGKDITAASLTAVVAGVTSITVTITTDGSNTTQDNILFSGFKIYPTGPGSGDLVRTAGTFSVQGTTGNPTSTESFGHMVAGPPAAYSSSVVKQYDTTSINKNCSGTTNGILEIQVNVTNPCQPITVTRFDFNTGGSTNPATDITEAEIYYTGQTRGLNYDNWFGLTPNPNGAFSITGSQNLTLGAGTYYFYLVYDVPSTATVGDSLDASMASFVINGVTQTDMSTPNPTGARAISTGTCSPTPDVLNPPAHNQTATAGSLVIPMDNAHQNLYAGLTFNVKAYGLIHSLLMNDIPVKWVIKSGKAINAPDFIASASRVYPSAAPVGTQTFVASAFIVDSQYVNHSFYPGGKTATKVITDFQAITPAANVAVYQLAADVTVDVRYTLTARPKIAVFSNGTFDSIHKNMLDNARITNYTVQNAGDFQGLASCYTFCSEAHWQYKPGDPVTGNLAPVQNVVDFVKEGGNFLAQCAGIDLYENHQPNGGHFHTTDGIDSSTTTQTNTSYNPDMAFNQRDETGVNPGVAAEAGYISCFWPKPSSKYKPETYYGVSTPLATNSVVASGAHLADPDSIGSNVFYLSGHSYNRSNTIGDINGIRMYLNASLIPAKRPSAFHANVNADKTICYGQSYPLGGNPTGPAGAIYTWTPATGLDNPNSPNPVATPSVTTTYFLYINNNGCPGTGQVTVTVVPKPTASITAVSSQTVCANNANITLTGAVTNATGGTWTSSGTGTFSPNNVTLPTVTYTPSNADIVAGRVTFTLTSTGNNAPCAAATSTVAVTITPAPTANAGNDTTVCASNRNVAIKGKLTVAGGGIWSSNGTGTFNPNANTLNATYVISDADTAAHSVKLVLTTTLNGACNAVTDTMTIFITPQPKATVGAVKSVTVCANALVMLTTTTVTNGTGMWTASGGGVFNPNSTASAISYSLSTTDIAAGTATLTLTATGSGACGATKVQDILTVTITPLPTSSVGTVKTTTVCANALVMLTSTTVTNGTGAWTSSGGGIFTPSTTESAISYSLSTTDIAAGLATLTLTATGNGVCGTTKVQDILTVTVTPLPTSSVGTVKTTTVCANALVMLTSATVTNGTGIWTSSGGGAFNPDNTAGAMSYSLSVTDTASGIATLTLTTTGSGVCGTTKVQDILTVNITPLPISLTGTADTILRCANDSIIDISNRKIYNGSGLWTTNGTGRFDPTFNGTAIRYTLSHADTASRNVMLHLTVTGTGACGSTQAIDSTLILVSPEPIAITGTADTIPRCSNDSIINISGRTIYNGGGLWTSTGSGRFDPTYNETAIKYTLSKADTIARSVMLRLTVTGTGVCGGVKAKDSTLVLISPEPIAITGTADTVPKCANDRILNLATRTIYNGTALWTTSGIGGNFIPGNNITAVQYFISDADTAMRNVMLHLTVTGTGACGSVKAVDSVLIKVTPEPHAVLLMTNDTSVCANVYDVPIHGKVINATGVWSTYDGTGGFLPNTTVSATTYSLSLADTSARIVHLVINATGLGVCNTTIAKDTLTIRTSPPPSISVGATSSITVCTNKPQVQLNGSVLGATGIIWSTTNGTGAFTPNDTLDNAVYNLSNVDTAQPFITLNITSTGNGACNLVTKPLQIVLKKAPRPDFTDSSVCKNLVTPFYDKSIVPAPPYSSVWKFGDGAMSATPSHTYATDGIYTATLIITDNNNCVDSIAKPVTIYPLPVANFINTANCFRNAVYFYDLSTVTNLVTSNTVTAWNWNFGDGSTSTLQNPSHTFPSATTFTSTLIATSNRNCSSIPAPITFNVTPAPVAKFSADSVCLNNTTHFTDLSSPVIVTSAPLTYTLDFGDNTTPINNLAIPHTYSTPGNHFATLIVQAQNGCYDTILNTIVVHPLPQVRFSTSTFCSADSTHFFSTSTINTGTIKAWSWNFGDGTTASGNKVAHKYQSLGSGDVTFGVTLKDTSNYNCAASYATIVTIHPSPKAAFTTDKNVIELHNTVQFHNISKGADSLSRWDFGDTITATSTATNPSYKYDTKAGTFTTKLVVTNSYNCSDSTIKDIIVKLPPTVPNIFTPNGDGHNDILYVLGGPYKDLEFRVLNNWGEYIFYSASQSLGWDGTKNGVKQPVGVYVYTITATTEDGERHTLYGDVTLLR